MEGDCSTYEHVTAQRTSFLCVVVVTEDPDHKWPLETRVQEAGSDPLMAVSVHPSPQGRGPLQALHDPDAAQCTLRHPGGGPGSRLAHRAGAVSPDRGHPALHGGTDGSLWAGEYRGVFSGTVP